MKHKRSAGDAMIIFSAFAFWFIKVWTVTQKQKQTSRPAAVRGGIWVWLVSSHLCQTLRDWDYQNKILMSDFLSNDAAKKIF